MSGVRVSAENVSKEYENTKVLRSINLTIQAGEFVVIIGRSGCGKSTLLRILSGLEQSSNGLIKYGDHEIFTISPEAKIMFQDHRLLPWQTVGQNVELGMKIKDKQSLIRTLTLVGLEEKINEWPSVLSGGQKQRVSLARALASNPEVLLLDEPLGALDALTRLEMQKLIENLWKEQKFTSIFVTHDVSEAVLLADRIILIENGEIGLDLKIDLPRPREINSRFSDYQNQILEKLMN